jgi:uncharacterized membrane protein YcaP (DUF421 family)
MPIASLASDLFVPQVSLVEKVVRALLVFGFLVVALRLGGKRELGQINVLDFAVLLEHGRAHEHALRSEAITVEELQAAALERGFEQLAEVDLIVLQPNGHLAIMGREAAGAWRARHADADAPPARS